jgi:predicted amino acid racemase
MLDLGDYREGIQPEGLPVLLEQIRAERFAHVTLDGLGTTLGCLMGVPPHPGNMADLRQAVETVENILGTPLSLVSLGGSACLEWCMRHPHIPDLPPGCALELRAEAALLLGYDDYRNLPFPEGAFRRDVFRLSCTVLEVLEKNIAPPALRISGGNGFSPLEPGDAGRRIRALVDCGSQNTEVEDLEPELPGARIVGHSANYVVLDVTAVSEPLKVGGRVFFRPGLWAAGRSLRARQVGKRCCRSRKNRVA